MSVIKLLVNRTCGAIELPFVKSSYYIMEPGAVSSFTLSAESVVTHDGMASIIITIIQDNKFWGIRRSGQLNIAVSRGNRNGSWKRIRGIDGSFIQAGAIINGHERYIPIWVTTINCKYIFEAVIKFPVFVFSH